MDLLEAERYDQGMRFLERLSLSNLRRELVVGLDGRILEIGTGTGANTGFYDHAVDVTAIDLRENFLRAAAAKAARNGQATYAATCADAQHLPFETGAFDAVVGALVFCSIADPLTALREICRVLRPGGHLHLLEHVRGQNIVTRALTDVFHPLWFALQGECHLNRETARTVTAAGFTLQRTSKHGGGLLQMIKAMAPQPCGA
jgi:ubiquinone/menaquinone biosynthesis C-methylase UbiE